MHDGAAMRRFLIMAVGFTTAACSSQLSYDLGKAEDACHETRWPGKEPLVRCLDARERPVWAKDEPATLDLYNRFARERADLASQFDQGKLDEAQYRDRLAAVEHDLRAEITARRQSVAVAVRLRPCGRDREGGAGSARRGSRRRAPRTRRIHRSGRPERPGWRARWRRIGPCLWRRRERGSGRLQGA